MKYTSFSSGFDASPVPLQRVMQSLRDRLVTILDQFDIEKPVFYFDYPVHLNVGDLLINLGTEQFFREHNLKIWRRYSINDYKYGLPRIDRDVTVLCHGGGNFGDLWKMFQDKREELLERYPQNRVIVLPQTVHFQSSAEERRSLAKFAAHRNSHIFVRDSTSLETLQKAGMSSVSAMPDMAHCLWGILRSTQQPTQPRTLRLIRRDLESKPLPEEYRQESDSADTWDWDTIVGGAIQRRARFAQRLIKLQRLLHLRAQMHRVWYPVRDAAVCDGVKLFSNHTRIYTDRLHAMILGCLLEKDVVAFDNSYGKLSSYYGTWLKGSDNITFITPEQKGT